MVLDAAWDTINWWRRLHARPLSRVASGLRYHVDRSDGRVQGRIDVAQRLKRLETLVGKLSREPGNVTQMQDIGGARAVLPTLRHVYVVRRRLLKTWSKSIVKERDYIATPKASGYRAVHLIVRRGGCPIEIQLRTVGQDVWANVVEKTGREHGMDFKFGAGDQRLLAVFRSIADSLARFERGEASADELRKTLGSMS